MTDRPEHRGGAPVGMIAELNGIEAASVTLLRLWSAGPDARAQMHDELTAGLGGKRGRRALHTFETLCSLCAKHGRRPLLRHALRCACLGADESCFANFIATAATGEREDAMLFAMLLVRPDVAPLATALAAEFGLALLQVQIAARREHTDHLHPQTLH